MPPLDLETPGLPSLERPRTPTVRPSAGGGVPASFYALSAVDGSIATSLLGPRATSFLLETFYATSAVDGSIATSSLGERATFVH